MVTKMMRRVRLELVRCVVFYQLINAEKLSSRNFLFVVVSFEFVHQGTMQIQCKTLTFTVSSISANPKLPFRSSITLRSWKPQFPSFRSSSVSQAKSLELNRFIRKCASPNQELVVDGESGNGSISPANEEVIELQGDANGTISSVQVEVEEVKVDDLANQSIWGQMKEIVMFTGPAAGLWLCAPLMSLIDTAVIGQGSSLELAALGMTIQTHHKICVCLTRFHKLLVLSF